MVDYDLAMKQMKTLLPLDMVDKSVEIAETCFAKCKEFHKVQFPGTHIKKKKNFPEIRSDPIWFVLFYSDNRRDLRASVATCRMQLRNRSVGN